MSEEQKATTPTATNPMDALRKKLGITSSQVKDKAVTVRKSKGDQPNLDVARKETKVEVKRINASNGQHIKSDTFIKDGKMKDKDGKVMKDAKGDIVWNYKHVSLDGDFMIDVRDDGLFDVSRICWYSETFQVGDYAKVDKVSK